MAEPKAHTDQKPIHTDHRARMRARVKKYGLDSLAEHEALEYLLYYVIPRRDTNPTAHALLERFGSFAGVLEASEADLCQVPGVGPAAAGFLHTLLETDRCYLLSRARQRRRLDTTEKCAEYLIPFFRGETHEKLLMLALDDRNRLLRTVWLDEGSAGGVDVSVRSIGAQAVSAGAAAIVLAHNHPDGVPLPSRDDLLSTSVAMRALALLDIRVQDHIILAGDEWLSLRDSGRMPKCDLPADHITGL